ncbi:MAG: pyridoxamine 5'-phosphate oxidase family protein [Magnetococcus sp. DMHC-6]
MGKLYTTLSADHQAFIAEQNIFFVATVAPQGRINLSPKGLDTFRCLDERRAVFLNLTGSSNETAAHLLADGRITVMFCGFAKTAKVLRIYGHGRVVHPRDADWERFMALFPDHPGKRQLIVIEIESVQSSCGFGVPIFEFQGERPALMEWTAKKGEQGIAEYWRERNQTSIDGLPTLILEA